MLLLHRGDARPVGTEEEYQEALDSAKHVWRDYHFYDVETGIDPEDYETEEEFEEDPELSEDDASEEIAMNENMDYEEELEIQKTFQEHGRKGAWRSMCRTRSIFRSGQGSVPYLLHLIYSHTVHWRLAYCAFRASTYPFPVLCAMDSHAGSPH